MSDISKVAPISIQMLPRKERLSIESVVDKIVTSCVAKHTGRNLLVNIYLSGLYHGTELANQTKQK